MEEPAATRLIAVRALSLALHPAVDPDTAARALSGLAQGNAAALRGALQRIQSRRPERSHVTDRAVAILRLALATLDERDCA